MEIVKKTLNGAYLLKLKFSQDERGFFTENYSKKAFAELGIEADFVQDNHSMSVTKGVLRGLHFQDPPHTQAKLVRVTKGAAYDVIVDLRKDSPTFGQWEGFELTDNNHLMLFVPQGFAHGFCTLVDYTEFQYKCDNYYAPESEHSIIWNDPTLKIYWPACNDVAASGRPIENPILSDKDSKGIAFSDLNSPF